MKLAGSSWRYALVSGSCLLMHNAIVIIADRLGLTLLAAAGSSFCIVVFWGFALHSRYTFAMPVSWRGFQRYALAMAMAFPMSVATLWFVTVVLRQPMATAAPAATALMLAFNYASSAWAITFKHGARS